MAKDKPESSETPRYFPLALTGILLVLWSLFGYGRLISPQWFGFVFRSLVAVTGLALIWGYTYLRHVRPLRTSSIERDITKVLEPQVRELQRLAGANPPDLPQVRAFTTAILTPVTLRERLTERFIPGQRTLRQTVEIEVQIPQSTFRVINEESREPENVSAEYLADKALYFPVISPTKGDLLDSFRLADPNGDPIPVLSYTRYLQIVTSIIRALIMNAYGVRDVSELPAHAISAEQDMLLAIIERRGGHDRSDAVTVADYERRFPDAKVRRPRRMAAELAVKLSKNYALLAVVHCDADRRITFQYERTVIPEMRISRFRAGERMMWIKQRSRLLLGARPIELTIPLINAWACQSYHLLVDSADGLFLAKQHLSVHMNDYFRGKKYVSGVPPYYRFRRRLGQTYAHFYARFLPEPRVNEPIPAVTFSYFETPPGSIFRAAVASAAGAALIWLVSFVLSHDGQQIGSDAPAILLAFPAVAAAWLGFESPSRRLLEATLPTPVRPTSSRSVHESLPFRR